MHYQFHVNVYARPTSAVDGAAVELRGSKLPTLRGELDLAITFDAFLPVTFEEAAAALAKLPGTDVEPDGFFVVSGAGAGDRPARWRVSGHLFDFDDRLHRMELHGDCPRDAFDALLACVDWPETSLAFELVEQGVVLDESAFREFANRAVFHGGA